eukprot:750342-Hanusia_phi.AAC.2
MKFKGEEGKRCMSGTVVITEWEGMEDEGFEWILEPEDAVRAMEEAKLLGHGEGEGEGEGGGGGGGDRACKRIMIVGCGSSKLSKILYDRGHKRITNVDIDESIIADMRRRYENEAPEMSWVACDITRAKGSLAEDEIFDLVLDKGTLDALLCADGVTDVSSHQHDNPSHENVLVDPAHEHALVIELLLKMSSGVHGDFETPGCRRGVLGHLLQASRADFKVSSRCRAASGGASQEAGDEIARKGGQHVRAAQDGEVAPCGP